MARKPIKTDKSIQALKSESNEYYNPVENHPKLFIRVRPNGHKEWFYKYHRNKKISFGQYPQTSLAVAFEHWHNVNQLLAKGIEPKEHRQATKQAQENINRNRFNVVCWLWLASLNESENTIKRKRSRLNELCGHFGDIPLENMKAPFILNVLETMQKSQTTKNGGVTDKAERCASMISQIFEYANVKGYCTSDNPMPAVKKHLQKAQYDNRPAITKPLAFAQLLQDIHNCVDMEISTKHSLQLLALLFVRNGDLRRMRWADIDFERCEWCFKPIKGRGREIMVKDMIIPLPPQAIAILRNQHQLTGAYSEVFYSDKSKYGVISDGTAERVLKKLGYQDKHCVHGYRATATTLLLQELGFEKVIIEMAMGHVVKDANGTAYARHDFLQERKEMMTQWANYIDALQNNQDTRQFKMIYRQNQHEVLQILLNNLGKDEILRLIQDK